MTKIRSFFTSLTAMAVGAISFASTTDVAKAQTHNTNPYVNAAVMSHIPNAPRSKGSCGIFETCASTEHGLGKGNFMVGLSAVYIMPQDRNQRIWARPGADGHWLALGQGGGGLQNNGDLFPGAVAGTHGAYITTTNPVMPELNLRYFITDHISVGLIATSSRTQVELYNVPGIGHSLNVGTIWVLPPTLTFAWHFLPHRRFNPYVGLGANIDWFHNGTGNLTASKAGPGIGMPQLNAGFTGGPSLNAGFDYQLVGNWFFNLDIKQMFVRMHAWAKGGLLDQDFGRGSEVIVHEGLDPTVVSAGIAYRFF